PLLTPTMIRFGNRPGAAFSSRTRRSAALSFGRTEPAPLVCSAPDCVARRLRRPWTHRSARPGEEPAHAPGRDGTQRWGRVHRSIGQARPDQVTATGPDVVTDVLEHHRALLRVEHRGPRTWSPLPLARLPDTARIEHMALSRAQGHRHPGPD